MKITTQSAIDISESLAAYILASYIYQTKGEDVRFERRYNYVDTGKFSRADIYYRDKDMGIEVKSTAHGSGALKGVLQASMYKEQSDNGVFCMQRPRREALRSTLESMCSTHGVGLVYIESIPSICSDDTIENATGGCTKPFELWKDSSYERTKMSIVGKSRSDWIGEYVETLDRLVYEHADEIFNFKIEPDPSVPGLSEVHKESEVNQSPLPVGDI